MEFERIRSGLCVLADSGKSEPDFVAAIEAEIDLMAKPVPRKCVERHRRGDAENDGRPIDNTRGLAVKRPTGGGSGETVRDLKQYAGGEEEAMTHWDSG